VFTSNSGWLFTDAAESLFVVSITITYLPLYVVTATLSAVVSKMWIAVWHFYYPHHQSCSTGEKIVFMCVFSFLIFILNTCHVAHC